MLAGLMTEPPDGVSTAIQRQMLRVVVRNSARGNTTSYDIKKVEGTGA